MYKPKFSIILGNVGMCADRFLSSGYSKPFTVEQMFERVASIKGVEGIELVSHWHVTEKNVQMVKENMQNAGLKLAAIIPDHFGEMKWGKGAFSSKDPQIRRDAVSAARVMMDIASELGGNMVSLWPGQDGYDYLFQGDYIEERSWFEDGVRECVKYRPDVRVSIEYKIKEPRNFSYPSTAAACLLMANAIGDNCGVTIDYGHAQVAGENVAESVALLTKYGNKLFHVHMNDNYGYWDDDMITGMVHTIPFIEFFYWLKRVDYKGYVSTDQYPYRENGRDAVNESIRWFEIFTDLADRIDERTLSEIYKTGNACEVSAFLRKLMFGK